jgi:hypothetical protein
MISIKYKGRLGNQMFQYAFARILAEKNNYKLNANSLEIFSNTKQKILGKDFSNKEKIVVSDSNYKDYLDFLPNKHIILDGYFAHFDILNKNRKNILNWFSLNKKFKLNKKSVVVHIRRTDFIEIDCCLPMSYYDKILSELEYDKIYVCTDDINDWFVKKFIKKYNAKIFHKSLEEDFSFMVSAKKLILSQSTFGWWIGFLSSANEIYFPNPKKGFWSDKKNFNNLKMNYDSVKYVTCGLYKISFLDIFGIVKRKISPVLNKIKRFNQN